MKRRISVVFMLILVLLPVFAQSYSLETVYNNQCSVILDGEYIVIQELLFGGYVNKVTIPKEYFKSPTETIMVSFETGSKSVINNPSYMEFEDSIYIVKSTERLNNAELIGFLSVNAVYHSKYVDGIWLYKRDVDSIAEKLGL